MNTKNKVWKRIKIGNGPKTGDEYIKLICSKKRIIVPTFGAKYAGPALKISQSANDAILSADFKVSAVEKEIELVKMSLGELGLNDGAKLSDIMERGLKNGRTLCPAEVGPQLRLQYEDQASGERLVIVMKPVVDDNDFPLMFSVENDAYQWLETVGGFSSNNMFNNFHEFIFGLCK